MFLPKSNRFGFTGTPLLNDGEITKLTFGSEDENGEIDYTPKPDPQKLL